MKRLKQPIIRNAKGEPIRLTPQEQYHANWCQRQLTERFGNSLGYEVSITTLTTIAKKISEQKFFQIAPADYLPVVVGQGAWSSNLTTYRSFVLGDEFETGIVNLGGQNMRMAMADAAVDALNIKVNNWAKATQWSIMELEQAAKSGNWDLVSAKEEARKTNWDLGIQRVAFLGARGLNATGGTCLGLLNQPTVNVNTTVITKAISSMNTAELKVLCKDLIEAYRSNCNRTAWPTHFVIPESDYNGLASQSSPDFPIKSVLQVLEETFQIICRNKDFKILPLAYADNSYSGLGYQLYTLLRYDEKSVRMDIPVDYTNTLANSIDNFQFQNAGYGQFTGVLAYRPLEMLYFKY
jgi:hypothetical protein